MRPARGSLARWRRRLDRRFYRTLFNTYRALFPSRAWAGPIDPATLRRVLVVRHDRIGDAVVTTPLLSLLRAALPHAEIDVLASPANRSIFDGDDRVTRVFVNDHGTRSLRPLVRALRGRHYDAIFSVIYGHGIREGVLAALVSSRHTHRLSVHRPARYAGLFSATFRTPQSRIHMADRLLHVVGRALRLHTAAGPVNLERHPMQLPRDPEAERRADAILAQLGLSEFALVNLWAAESWRVWDGAHFAQVTATLQARGSAIPILLVPPPGHQREAELLAASCGKEVHVAPSSGALADLVAIVRRAALVITPDTAVVHIACACERPIVALYSARTVDIARWQPVGVPSRTLVAPGREPVSAIPADAVVEAIESFTLARLPV